MPSSTSFAPTLLDSPEKKSDSTMIVAISAIEAPGATSCPKGVEICPASLDRAARIESDADQQRQLEGHGVPQCGDAAGDRGKRS